MVDHESMEDQYATMIATLTQSSDMEPASVLESTSKVLEIQNLSVITTDRLEKPTSVDILNLDSSSILPTNEQIIPKIMQNHYGENYKEFFNGSDGTRQNNNFYTLEPLNSLANFDLSKPNIVSAINSLPPQNCNNTAVEQPNIGPSSCFICGHILADPGERFTYLKTQKLFSMQMSLLQLLSDIINKTVFTNTDNVDLCQLCSETMNEIDILYKNLNDLKQTIIRLFNSNKRPKLTFHILDNSAQTVPCSKCTVTRKKPMEKIPTFSLDDLAYTRRKHRETKGSKTIPSKESSPIKKKVGRPRKPFQCIICKRKFITNEMVKSHIKREHDSKCKETESNQVSKDDENLVLQALDIVKTEAVDSVYSSLDQEIKPIVSDNVTQCMYIPLLRKLSLCSIQSNGLSSLNRPIQPKPHTVVQTAVDGSLLFLMKPISSESSPTLIKISKDYLNMHSESIVCDLCGKNFPDDKSMKLHKGSTHGGRKRKQDDDSVSKKSKMEDFNDKVETPLECGQCKASFQSKLLLSEHKRTAHSKLGITNKDHKKEKCYSCENCDQLFNYKYEYETHRETHLPFNQVGPHEFVCCICGLKVASKAALKIHLHRFHDKSPDSKDFLCAECGYMTSTKKAFSDHTRIHSECPEPKAKCHLCRKEMLRSSFKIHMLRMHGEAKYPCETCGQKFTVRSDLMRHLNIVHSSLKPYHCNLCSKKFLTAEALRYHKNKFHSMVLYFCGICGKSYKWKGELRNHTNRNHSGPRLRYECSVCLRTYVDRRKLKNHMASKHKVPTTSRKTNHKMDECGNDNSMQYSTIEIHSSVYEPQGDGFTAPQTIITSESNSDILDEEGATIIQTYERDDQESITMTTLHSHIPSENHHYQTSTIDVRDQQATSGKQVTLHSQGSHSAVLSQHSDNISEVPSIYLVSDMPVI